MHGNQTVDWSRIDSERVSGWSRFRNGKKKTADSRYRQHGKRRSPHTRTCICIIIRLSVLILIEPFSVFIGFTWCYFYTQFFFAACYFFFFRPCIERNASSNQLSRTNKGKNSMHSFDRKRNRCTREWKFSKFS